MVDSLVQIANDLKVVPLTGAGAYLDAHSYYYHSTIARFISDASDGRLTSKPIVPSHFLRDIEWELYDVYHNKTLVSQLRIHAPGQAVVARDDLLNSLRVALRLPLGANCVHIDPGRYGIESGDSDITRNLSRTDYDHVFYGPKLSDDEISDFVGCFNNHYLKYMGKHHCFWHM
jgi:hypothetical protein